MVGLRYTLEGIEVRGNTTTLARVVLRYVHFRAGDTLNVDDAELELTRFRLLGTGFFSEVALSLAKKSGGQVQVDQVAKASGLSRDEATTRMRQLTGRGLFDLDFDANGQMVWKLTPDAGRAQLAEIAGRSG